MRLDSERRTKSHIERLVVASYGWQYAALEAVCNFPLPNIFKLSNSRT